MVHSWFLDFVVAGGSGGERINALSVKAGSWSFLGQIWDEVWNDGILFGDWWQNDELTWFVDPIFTIKHKVLVNNFPLKIYYTVYFVHTVVLMTKLVSRLFAVKNLLWFPFFNLVYLIWPVFNHLITPEIDVFLLLVRLWVNVLLLVEPADMFLGKDRSPLILHLASMI